MLRDGRGGIGGEAMSLCRRDILRVLGCFCDGGSSCAALFASSKSKSKDISGLVHHWKSRRKSRKLECRKRANRCVRRCWHAGVNPVASRYCA
jgi:hypothetical protein